MRMTDYSKIADRYDLNPARKLIPYESIIGEILKSTDSRLNILDLACGTGNYLHIQHQRYGHSRITWYGCDLSLEMLRIASSKNPYAHLTFCDAASLPYPDKSFEMITCNFAFHHFKGKSGCLDEIRRTLKAKGVFLLQNISPEDMTSWWVYHYFPSTRAIDQARFWNKGILQSELQKRGFNVEINTIEIKELYIKDPIVEAENRDISQLNLVDESEYREGMDQMKRDLKAIRTYNGDLVVLRIIAKRTA